MRTSEELLAAAGAADQSGDALLGLVGMWLRAEADHLARYAQKTMAVNLLLAAAEETVEARVRLGYDTIPEALAVARAIIGGAQPPSVAAVLALHDETQLMTTTSDECEHPETHAEVWFEQEGEVWCMSCGSVEMCCRHCSNLREDIVAYPCETVQALTPGGSS